MPSSKLSKISRERRQYALGRALGSRRAELGMSQTELAIKMNEAQTNISRWERGLIDFTFEKALEIEVRLAMPIGTLAEAGGYVSSESPSLKDANASTIKTLLTKCPDLNPEFRQSVIVALEAYVRASKLLEGSELREISEPPRPARARRRQKVY